MRITILMLLLLLSACGGGEVNCTAAGACVVSVGSITTGSVSVPSAPASAASSPSPAASAPAVTPPAQTIPLAVVHQLPPAVTITAGDLRWSAQGVTYMVGIATNGDASWVAVWSVASSSSTGMAGAPVSGVEVMLDSGFDLRGVQPDDAAIRAYLAAYVVPKLNTWMTANSGRWASGMTVYAVNTKDTPTGSASARAAARVAQWIDITPFGATLK